jgi:hypothetical protein
MLDNTVSLHSSQPISGERRRSPIVILVWVSVIIANLTLGGLIWFSISTSRASGYQSRAIEDLTSDTDTMRREIEIWRVYIETLRNQMVARGIEVEPLPDLTDLRKD